MLAFEDNAKSKADNTRVNKRDREKGAVTADQAKENLTDRQLMQKIRKSVMNDKSLSTYAHNVKIIATNGKVTLKGPVRSDEERKTIYVPSFSLIRCSTSSGTRPVIEPPSLKTSLIRRELMYE